MRAYKRVLIKLSGLQNRAQLLRKILDKETQLSKITKALIELP
jgi:hypothetical protein